MGNRLNLFSLSIFSFSTRAHLQIAESPMRAISLTAPASTSSTGQKAADKGRLVPTVQDTRSNQGPRRSGIIFAMCTISVERGARCSLNMTFLISNNQQYLVPLCCRAAPLSEK